MRSICATTVFLLVIAFSSYAHESEAAAMSTFTISSPAFKHNEYIPVKFTCDGANVNPALAIENVPPGTKSLALIVDDPDAPAGIWVHWVVWNIGPDTNKINEQSVPPGAVQGLNDFRRRDYGGPCPPSGVHRYFFKLYALDTLLTLGSNADMAKLEAAMKGHVLAQAVVMGKYTRK